MSIIDVVIFYANGRFCRSLLAVVQLQSRRK